MKNRLPEELGIARFNRVSGNRNLYGSPFTHPSYVELTISRGKMETSYGKTEYWAQHNNPYIVVDFSNNQFAELITTMNIGSGIPCTVHRFNGQTYNYNSVKPEDNRVKVNHQIDESSKTIINQLNELIQIIEEEKMSQRTKARLINQARRISLTLRESLPYVVKQYSEYLDRLEQQSKTEIASYADIAIKQYGLDKLNTPTLLLPEGDDTLTINEHDQD